ncbi:MAG: hypothetical protein UV60_C0003G0004 [Parcubacteria group bacterium GW2011_GWA2_43_11]|nr:MAG: hypothetical protein UU89_C0010G0004 [Parcubacteria group bacterium GW2011_GWC2_42_11]KKS86086.1 MAG: hypothetical protein UV60_C0003G0004 [Parcubacteria group bacterium GW2011_GWA2_43_11]
MNESHKDMGAPHLSKKILDLIEQKGLSPKPRWHFFVREWVVWGMVCVALLVGSLATTLTIYIGNASRFMERHILFSDLLFLFRLVPFLWLFLLCIAIFYTVYALRETRRGYRWSSSWLVAGAVGVSILIGSSAHALGIGEAIDRYLLTEMPLYKPLTNFHPKMWMDMEKGVVAGTVTEVEKETFMIKKLDGEILKIMVVSEKDMHALPELHEGMRVRVVGTTTIEGGENVFKSTAVEPFRGRGGSLFKRVRIPPLPEMKER